MPDSRLLPQCVQYANLCIDENAVASILPKLPQDGGQQRGQQLHANVTSGKAISDDGVVDSRLKAIEMSIAGIAGVLTLLEERLAPPATAYRNRH